MKLRNKKTGRVVEWFNNTDGTLPNSLAELNEEWKDYEEPKGNWTIDPMNEDYIDDGKYTAPDELERYEELGLKFDTEEDAKKAVEKLKAWKRLKDKGFEFTGITPNRRYIKYNYGEVLSKYGICYKKAIQFEDDLDILFGGEE